MEQAGAKYIQLKKLEYLQEKVLIHPSGRSAFGCHNQTSQLVKLLARLRLGLQSWSMVWRQIHNTE